MQLFTKTLNHYHFRWWSSFAYDNLRKRPAHTQSYIAKLTAPNRAFEKQKFVCLWTDSYELHRPQMDSTELVDSASFTPHGISCTVAGVCSWKIKAAPLQGFHAWTLTVINHATHVWCWIISRQSLCTASTRTHPNDDIADAGLPSCDNREWLLRCPPLRKCSYCAK